MFQHFDAYYIAIATELEATRIRPEWDQRPERPITTSKGFTMLATIALFALLALALAGFTL
jgi:hypothetical protein